MVWSQDEKWMVTADAGGVVKYWQSNMNNVMKIDAHQVFIPLSFPSLSFFSHLLFFCCCSGKRNAFAIWSLPHRIFDSPHVVTTKASVSGISRVERESLNFSVSFLFSLSLLFLLLLLFQLFLLLFFHACRTSLGCEVHILASFLLSPLLWIKRLYDQGNFFIHTHKQKPKKNL